MSTKKSAGKRTKKTPSAISKASKFSKISVGLSAKPASIGIEWLAYLLLAMAVLAAGLFSLPNYNQLLPSGNPFSGLPTRWFLYFSFAALVVLWRFIPTVAENQWDIPPVAARIGFWVFMAIGAYMRLENPTKPVGCFWDDNYIHTSDIRNILDYNEHPLLFPSGWREPLFPYLTAFLWLFSSKTSGVIMVLLSNTVMDLALLWACYLLGKEIGGRRMGLILLAMAAVSKPLIEYCKLGYATNTTPLACAFVLLFFLRFMKKPNWLHFMEWGAALGFGAVCYVPFRVWTPVLLGAGWLWVFSDAKERRFGLYRVVLGPGLLGAWAFLFLYKNSLLSETNPLLNLLTSPVVLILVALSFGFSYFKLFTLEKKKGFSKLFGWATAAFTTALLMTPFYLNPHYSSHTADISIFSKIYTPDPKMIWPKFWNNVWFSQTLSFGRENDVAHLPALGDSFFDFYVPLFALLGLSYFVARPSWFKAFLTGLYVVGLVPLILSNGPHSARLEGTVAPLLLVGAWGVNRLWLTTLQVRPSKIMNSVFALLLLLFFAWEFDRNTWLIHDWVDQKIAGVLVDDQARQELPNHRVYLFEHNPGFYTCATDIMADGKDEFQATDSNSIDLVPEEKGKDLALLIYGEDKTTQQKIEQEFPGIQWLKRSNHWQTSTENPCLWYVEIPFDRIPVGDTGLFHVRRVSPWSWRRRCYGRYGLGRGLILYEDKVTHWNDNLPPHQFIDWNNSMRVEGDWNVKTPGNYAFTVHTANVLWFFLDGKKVLEVKPREGLVQRTYKTSLSIGAHHVELVTAFTWEHQVPQVAVSVPGSGSEIGLDVLAEASAQP